MLQDTPPGTSSGITPYGANPPSSGNGTHDLKNGLYEYEVHSVGAQVYTDRWITGASTIQCTVNDYTHLNNTTILNYEGVTFTVYNTNNKVVASGYASMANWTNQYYGYGSCIISGLSATAKYYVRISVVQDNVTKSFSGSIAKYG